MPLDVVSVYLVSPQKLPTGTRWEVCAPGRTFYTFKAWHAALCQRAHELGFQVQIGSMETAHGLRIVTCEAFQQEERTA